ncbi:MAG: NAD(P)H-binding protein [Caulobacteraceae bacterium]|nr:NAD(P)H-binding protein [Caulobacteraceae bacterium]
MRLCILGATGNSGRRIVSEAVARGHQVTALVRTAGALAATPNLNVGQMDFSDVGALENALRARDVVINAAGYVADGSRFTDLVGRIINATASALGPGGRFWLFGGAALLDVPGARGWASTCRACLRCMKRTAQTTTRSEQADSIGRCSAPAR